MNGLCFWFGGWLKTWAFLIGSPFQKNTSGVLEELYIVFFLSLFERQHRGFSKQSERKTWPLLNGAATLFLCWWWADTSASFKSSGRFLVHLFHSFNSKLIFLMYQDWGFFALFSIILISMEREEAPSSFSGFRWDSCARVCMRVHAFIEFAAV